MGTGMRRGAAIAGITLVLASPTLGRPLPVKSGPRALVVGFDPRHDQVGVDAVAGGVPLRLLIDTAVDPSVIDRMTAAALKLKQRGAEAEIEGAGSSASATGYESTIDALTISGTAYSSIAVIVADLSALRTRYDAALDGILGYSLLKEHAVIIDYPRNRLTIFRNSGASPLGCRRSYSVPLQFQSEDNRLILVLGLKIGGKQVPAFLDTGSSGGLRIEDQAPSVAAIRAMLPLGEASSSIGARGVEALRTGTLNVPVTLGPFRSLHTKVALVPSSNPQVPVNIGNQFLRALGVRLLVDMPARRLGLYSDCR